MNLFKRVRAMFDGPATGEWWLVSLYNSAIDLDANTSSGFAGNLVVKANSAEEAIESARQRLARELSVDVASLPEINYGEPIPIPRRRAQRVPRAGLSYYGGTASENDALLAECISLENEASA